MSEYCNYSVNSSYSVFMWSVKQTSLWSGVSTRDSATRDRISSGGIVRGCGSGVALGQPSGMTSETICTWDSGLYNKCCFMVQASQCSVRE